MTKIRECAHCGKEVEVPDDLEDYIPVFCNSDCSDREQDLKGVD